MGLDSVELVLEVEEHFGVNISDDEACEIRTVGDLLALVESRVPRRDAAGCLSLPWFLKVRRLAREAARQPSLRVHPATTVCEALRPRQRRLLWRDLKELSGESLHELQRPAFVVVAIGLAAFATIPLLVASASEGMPQLAWAALTCGLGAWGLAVVTRPLKTLPPTGYKTFGQITRRLVGLEALAIGYPANARELIFNDLAVIVSDQLGVDLERVTSDARFVQDLGMD